MTDRPFLRWLRSLAALALIAALAACAGNKALEESRQTFATRSPEVALLELQEKVAADPRNLELRSYFMRQIGRAHV